MAAGRGYVARKHWMQRHEESNKNLLDRVLEPMMNNHIEFINY